MKSIPFGDLFIQQSLAVLCRDLPALKRSLDWLSPELFEHEDSLIPAAVVRQLHAHVRRYGSLPLHPELSNAVERDLASILPGSANGLGRRHRRYVGKLFTMPVPETEQAVGQLRDFSRRRRMLEALEEQKDSLEKGAEFDAAKIAAAGAIAEERSEVDTSGDHAAALLERKENEGRCPCGFPTLDNEMNGGLPTPGLGVFAAPPKGFKTSLLIHVAGALARQGQVVAYASIELSERVLVRRLCAALSGKSMRSVNNFSASRAHQVAEKHFKSLRGSVVFRTWPPKGATAETLASWADGLRKRPSALIVDYADYLKPQGISQEAADNLYQAGESVYEQLQAVSTRLQIPIWTATLLTREGAKRKRPEMHHISHSYMKAALADILISMTQDEDERRIRKAWLYVMGSRISSSGVTVHVNTDPRSLRIWEGPAS